MYTTYILVCKLKYTVRPCIYYIYLIYDFLYGLNLPGDLAKTKRAIIILTQKVYFGTRRRVLTSTG